MGIHVSTAKRWFRAAGPVARIWTGSVVVLGLGGAVLAAESTAAVAQQRPGTVITQAAGSSAPVQPSAPMSAMAGMGGSGTASGTASSTASGSSSPTGSKSMSGMSGMSGMPGMGGGTTSGSSNSSGICPNVQGATVMSNGMVMAPVPSGPPTPAEQAAANQLVANVTAGIAKYSNVSAAEAAGYSPATSRKGPSTHYSNYSIVKAGDVLDPNNPSSLVYANTVNGPVLLGAMFLGPAPCVPGPDVGGPLTDWHAHNDLCTMDGVVVGNTGSTGACSSGNHNTDTYFMLHVWISPKIAAQYQFGADLPISLIENIDHTGVA